MNNLKSILDGIILSADEEIKKIEAEAEKEISDIESEYKKQIESESNTFESEIKRNVANIISGGKGSADGAYRRAIQKAKSEALAEITENYKSKILSLDDENYFEFLKDLCKKYAENTECRVYLSYKDKSRNASVFSDKLKGIETSERKFELSEKYSDEIESGCIVSYGLISENLSIESILEDKADEIKDALNSAIYGENK